MLGALNVAELAVLGNGLRAASLKRAGHLETPQIVFAILINFYIFLFVFLFCKKWPSTRPVSDRLLCFYHTLSAVAAVEAGVPAAVAVTAA